MTTAYTAATSNASDEVNATATDPQAAIAIKVGTTDVENGGDAEWAEGENTLTVTVSRDGQSTTYTVTVTYTAENEPSEP